MGVHDQWDVCIFQQSVYSNDINGLQGKTWIFHAVLFDLENDNEGVQIWTFDLVSLANCNADFDMAKYVDFALSWF